MIRETVKHFYQLLVFLVLVIFTKSFLYASEISIDTLFIEGETDLEQCVNHSPTFSWRVKIPEGYGTDYRLLISLRSIPLSDSVLFREWELTPEITAFRFVDFGALKDNREYILNLKIVNTAGKILSGRNLRFRMNSPPSGLRIALKDKHICKDSLLTVPFEAALDSQKSQIDYRFQLAADSSFNEILVDTLIMAEFVSQRTELTLDLSSLTDNKFYYLRGRAFDGREYGEWSHLKSIGLNRFPDSPATFRLISPLDGDLTPYEPLLKWEKPNDPDSAFGGDVAFYKILISMDSSFHQSVISIDSVGNNWLKMDKLEKHAHYFWKVIAVDTDDNVSQSIGKGSFITFEDNTPPGTPELFVTDKILSPGGEICWIRSVDPEWLDSVFYRLSFFKDDTFEIVIRDSGKILPDTSFCFTLGEDLRERFTEGAEYFFILSAFDNWGGESPPTEINSFLWDDGINYPPLPPEDLIFPVDSVIASQQPVFKWSPASDPDSFDTPESLAYELQIYCQDFFCRERDTLVFVTNQGKTEFQIPVRLEENGRYNWRIRTIDPDSAKSAWSEFRAFAVNAIPEPPVSPVRIKYPGLLEEISPYDTLCWYPVDDPDPEDMISYRLEISEDRLFRETKYARNFDFSDLKYISGNCISFPVNSLISQTRFSDNRLYYIRIIPFDKKGLNPVDPPSVHRIIMNLTNNPPDKVVKYRYPASAGILIREKPLTFSWNPAIDPDFSDTKNRLRYQVAIWTESENAVGFRKIYTTSPGENRISINEELPDNVRYFFSIQAMDDEGLTSGWGDTLSFFLDLKKEPPFRITEGFIPSDTAIVETPDVVISWLPTADPDPFQDSDILRYKLLYFNTEDTTKKVTVMAETGESSVKLTGLKDDCYYIYSVSAIDPDGVQSQWSPRQIFGVNAVKSPPKPFSLFYPGMNNDSTEIDFSFSWQRTDDPDLLDKVVYFLYFGEDSVLENNKVISGFDDEEGDTISYKPTFYFEPGKSYYWGVVAVDEDGNETWGSGSNFSPFRFSIPTFAVFQPDLPTIYALRQNFPNPFNTETMIEYQIPEITNVRLAVYDLLGKKICTLFSGRQAPGIYKVSWDGKDLNGVPVPGGMYIYTMEASNFRKTRKMVLLR